ncbi:hypothetical protein SAMN05192566_1451 [Methylophilus rhizosphaerae]|uniref:Uncharacterized protein n=1 Tax=Methylophilus rhizosphaerae TaxID=492660 RepID=A0A1G9CGV8_9PROT|nr:hypothetical protein SAMN05192566_1451 [Methylophilus rhizosphaerae]
MTDADFQALIDLLQEVIAEVNAEYSAFSPEESDTDLY